MKILIISDSHGNIVNLNHVMGFAKKYGVSSIIHAGDWNNLESVETVLSYGIPLYAVLGNADIDPTIGKQLRMKSEKFDENFLIFKIGGRTIGITHKPSNNTEYFLDTKLDLIINGHLHSKYESKETQIKIIRPGAIITGNNFAIFDTGSNRVEFIEDD